MSVIEREELIEVPGLEEAEDEILILRKAYELLRDRTLWCQNNDALDDLGCQTVPWDENATQWCALGAIAWATGDQWDWYDGKDGDLSPRYVAARERLGLAVPGTPGPPSDSTHKIVHLNDTVGYEAIMAAFEKAIL